MNHLTPEQQDELNETIETWVRLLGPFVASALVHALASWALATLLQRLHDLGLPVPTPTFRQARKLWFPFGILAMAVGYRTRNGASLSVDMPGRKS